MDISIEQRKVLAEIFFPEAYAKRLALEGQPGSLVHYTTAENALRIVRSKEIWLRNTRVMHDYSEVTYGHSQLLKYFSDESRRNRFFSSCDGESPKKAVALFDAWWQRNQSESYIACFSEHEPTENDHGRLSMWRAFNYGSVGLAMVLNTPKNEFASQFGVILAPVKYIHGEDMWDEVERLIVRMTKHIEALKSLPPEMIVGGIYGFFVSATVGTKHPGFHEEKEWRVVKLPTQTETDLLSSAVEVINGIPQLVFKLKLENRPERGIAGLSVTELFNRFIIGPTQYGESIRESLILELTNAGIADAATKVVISGIPLRG